MILDTGWHPDISEYHAHALEGVISSSMLKDLVPPLGRPRLYRDYWVDQTTKRHRGVSLDMWRGTIVDAVLTEGARIGYIADLGCNGFYFPAVTETFDHPFEGDGAKTERVVEQERVVAVVPPKLSIAKNVDKERWAAWKASAAEQGIALIGLSQNKDGKETRDLTKAQGLLDEIEAIVELIESGATPAAELARELLQGESGVSQLSHRFEWNGIKCRWRPDRIVEYDGDLLMNHPSLIGEQSEQSYQTGYAHVSLKVTRHAHPSAFWNAYQKEGWGMRDAFYELGWAEMVAEHLDPLNLDPLPEVVEPGTYPFPWNAEAGGAEYDGWEYVEEEPIDWIVIAAHHEPVPEVFVHIVPEQQRRLGRKRCTAALELLKRCLDTDRWELPAEAGALLGPDPRPWEWGA